MNEGELPFGGGGGAAAADDENVSRQRLDEERRVAFVALSRAKDHLVCTWLHRFAGGKQGAPSQFLDAVPPALVANVVRDNPAHAARSDCGKSLHVPVGGLGNVQLVDKRGSAKAAGGEQTAVQEFFKKARGL